MISISGARSTQTSNTLDERQRHDVPGRRGLIYVCIPRALLYVRPWVNEVADGRAGSEYWFIREVQVGKFQTSSSKRIFNRSITLKRTKIAAPMFDLKNVAVEIRDPLLSFSRHLEMLQAVPNVGLYLAPEEIGVAFC